MAGFQPVQTTSSMGANLNQINRVISHINREQQVKVFKQGTGNAIVQGKLPYPDGYGTLYYSASGVPNIVIGILPDGTTGLVISKTGVSVLDVFA